MKPMTIPSTLAEESVLIQQTEGTVEQSNEDRIEIPVEATVEEPVQECIDVPNADPAEVPIQAPAELVKTTVSGSAEELVDEPTEEPTKAPIEQPVEVPIEKPASQYQFSHIPLTSDDQHEKQIGYVPLRTSSPINKGPNSWPQPQDDCSKDAIHMCIPKEPTNISTISFSSFNEDPFVSPSSQSPNCHLQSEQHSCIPETSYSDPNDPIPMEPTNLPILPAPVLNDDQSTSSASQSLGGGSSNLTTPATSPTKVTFGESSAILIEQEIREIKHATPKRRRASTALISTGPKDVRRILSGAGDVETKLVEKVCCGGGCCFMDALTEKPLINSNRLVVPPDNDAFRSLNLELGLLSLDSELTKTVDLPPLTVSFKPLSLNTPPDPSTVQHHPPKFVTPHFPYEVYPSRVHHARELTRPGAEKRTYHFDLDVTDYPAESGKVEFVVGGAVGVCAPNSEAMVDDIFDSLNVPSFVRDKQVMLKTETGRWPTIWGDDQSRELVTTRRELLTWCSDVQSYPPTKALLRLLAEYAEAEAEKKILMFLSSAQGQGAFCDLRTGPHITLIQLLRAFPSSHPPLSHLLSVLNALMPRFYSLSQDPQISRTRAGLKDRRLIEVAVTVHETPDWRGGVRTGVGSGYLERVAQQIIESEKHGVSAADLNLHIPMFRGLMSNPLAREFVTDGPMLLIGAGVGVAPFRGFVQRRLKSANCANKVWVLQGVRDSLLDELYSGEWGVEEDQVKKVIESRRGEGRYVQEEVRQQADLVWFVINALDGRVFVCGSSVGMGEGVEKALVDVVVDKGNLNLEEAEQFWANKKAGGQYIAVSIAFV